MKRKVIQLAGRTLVVSIPSAWASKYKIKKGDEVDISDDGTSLKITTSQKESGNKKISIDLSSTTRSIARAAISGLYKRGYDEITVNYNSKEVYDAIIEKKKEVLLGFTLHEISNDKLVLDSFTHDSPKEFENSLRRAFLVTMSMGENLLDAIRSNDFKNLKNIKTSENTNNQLTSFCERLINKGFVSQEEASFFYVICWNLEKACDPYLEIANLLEENKNMKLSPDVISLFEEVNAFLRGFYDALYNYSTEKIARLEDKKKKIMDKAKVAYKNKSSTECQIINNLFEIAALTSNFIGPITALNTAKLTG